MGRTLSSLAAAIPPPWRKLAVACIGASAGCLFASVLLALLQMSGVVIGAPVLLQLLPILTAVLGLFAGALCLMVRDTVMAPADGSAVISSLPMALSGLYAVVQELSSVLSEERDKAAAFEDVFIAAMREVRATSARTEQLTAAAFDAEARLGAVASQPAADSVPETAAVQLMQNALPEIAELIRRAIAEQTRTVLISLQTAAERLTTEANGPVQTLHVVMAEVTDQLKALSETAGVVRRDVAALDTAGRETAVANAKISARLSNAVAQIDVAMAYLPEAAATVTDAMGHAATAIAEASRELRADSAALETSRGDSREEIATMQRAAEALTARAQDLDTAGSQLGGTVAAAVEHAVQALAEASGGLQADGAAVAASCGETRQAVAAIQLAAEALTAKAQALENSGSRLGETMAEALAEMPAAAATVTAAVEQGTHKLAEVAAVLRTDGLALAECGRDTQRETTALGLEAAGLRATGRALTEAGHETIATVAKAAEMALAQLAGVIVNAENERESLTSFAKRTTALENVAATLVDNAYRLDEAALRSAAAGEWVVSRLDSNTARNEALLQTLPGVAAEMNTAAACLRQEMALLAAAAQQVSAAGYATTSAVTEVAVRAETAAASLDAAERRMNTASEAVETQGGRLAEAAGRATAKASLLPDMANDVSAIVVRIEAVAEAWKAASAQAEVAARVEAAHLDRIDSLSSRLEDSVAGLPGAQARDDMLTAIADVGASALRVEAALDEHERIWPSVAASIAQVEAAALAVAQATASAADARAGLVTVDFDAANAPAAVIATLRHFDEVACQSEMLLRQAEGLAEAVLSGRAPGLPPLLAERTPTLLSEIDTATRRLRSVATALALASDGVPAAERRLA